MIAKDSPIRQRIHDYLYNLEAMTRKEAKHLWRKSIKDAWSNRCAYCDNPPIDDASLTLDHVKPRAKGGEDKTSNCIPACKRCNHSKGSENAFEWFQRQQFYSIEREYRIRHWIDAEIKTIPISGDVYDCNEFVPNS
jgi:5-methylcytosine-specific restriction endonuclease McrA